MTHEEQDAIVGRTVRELRDIRERLAKLREKARDLGESYDTVGYHMRNKPENLRLSGESTDTRFIGDSTQLKYGSQPHMPKPETLEIKGVLAIRDEIRTCILEEERLVKSLSAMGYKDN